MLVDSFNREINYLRISVTDRCNLRCLYCMPAQGILHKPQSEILSFEHIYRIVKIAALLGITKVRITGGEPLVRKDLPLLIKRLKGIQGLKEIALTTNGIYLSDYAYPLKQAGLKRVNISLDSLDSEKFNKITRGGNLKDVFSGIESAFLAGFSPIKINVVLMKDFNEDEILDFVLLTKSKPLQVNFIECMPTCLDGLSNSDIFFSGQEAKEICQSLGKLIPINDGLRKTAKVFSIDGFCGRVGFISPISEPFCFSCNKLRLTSDGHLRSCLHSSKSIDLKSAVEKGISDTDLAKLIIKAVVLKPKSHNLLNSPIGVESESFSMCQIGG